ncbi:hypothetical protein SDC9_102230 [bioreactor metagenome]|uniref:Uncharacterized protein n=1 Tax=bioreactor metagenome TaxID=1076179 RepID=A0A645AWZ5_9ZZZZ
MIKNLNLSYPVEHVIRRAGSLIADGLVAIHQEAAVWVICIEGRDMPALIKGDDTPRREFGEEGRSTFQVVFHRQRSYEQFQ